MKKLKDNMALLGKSFAKEMLLYFLGVAVLLAGGIVLYLLRGMSLFLAIPLFLWIFYTYAYFIRYGNHVKKLYSDRLEEFIRLFTFLGIYINDGFNVFRALESIIAFATPGFKPLLETLVKEIEEDKTVTPFVAFASKFNDITVKEVMISVYQMIDEGQGGPYIAQFQHLFGRLSDEKHAMLKQRRIDSLGKLSILPLLGSGITMFMLTFSLVEIMGGIMNGL